MGDMLSQAEIDALLGGGGSDEPGSDAGDSPGAGGQQAASGANGALSAAEPGEDIDSILNDEQKDVLGEIGNISMGTSATTLFALLGHKVTIDTPRVHVELWEHLPDAYDRPCVGVRVDYKEGFKGSNILILKQRDVKVITSLMMGGDGEVDADATLTDIDLSAIGEAMNQMVGSSSTSLSSMIKKKIDIDTPHAFLLDFANDDFFNTVGFIPSDIIVCISFKMQVGDLIDSEIMQILPKEFAIDMVDTLQAEFFNDADKQEEQKMTMPEEITTPDASPQAAAPQMEASPQVSPAPAQMAPPPQMAQQQMPPPQYAPQYVPQQNINVQPVQFQNFDINAAMQQKENIDIIMDVPLEVTVELGRTHKKIKDILEFTPGTVVELDKLAGEPIDILVNGKFVARGEVVVIDENFGIRIMSIISPENRI